MCVNLQAKVHDLAGDDYRTSGIDYRECLFSRWRFGLEFDSAMKKKELELKFEEIPPQLSGSSSLPQFEDTLFKSFCNLGRKRRLENNVAYMALVGSFPFNSFMSRFLSGIGTAVLAFHDTYELEQNWSSSKA
ncbi:hypothetical protein YC2023_020349 [Brassica napus]